MRDTLQVWTRLTPTLVRALDRLAKSNGFTRSKQIAVAITDKLEQDKQSIERINRATR